MDTIRNADFAPSGFDGSSDQSSWKDKAVSKVSSMRDSVAQSVARIKPMISDKVSTVKPKIDETMSSVKPKVTQTWERVTGKARELGHKPAVLGGLAAAAGLTLGLMGRWMRHRAHAPTFLLIETC